MKLNMTVLDKKYAIWMLDSNAMIPMWLLKEAFVSMTRTNEELSIVCDQDFIGDHIDEIGNAKIYKNWSCLKIMGPLEFSLVGIISEISTVLAKAEISVFVVSTFNTDYILINHEHLEKAVIVLNEFGITFV